MNFARKPNRCERDVESERIPHVLSREERRSKLKTATLIICVAFVSALFLKRDCYLYRECQTILQRKSFIDAKKVSLPGGLWTTETGSWRSRLLKISRGKCRRNYANSPSGAPLLLRVVGRGLRSVRDTAAPCRFSVRGLRCLFEQITSREGGGFRPFRPAWRKFFDITQ